MKIKLTWKDRFLLLRRLYRLYDAEYHKPTIFEFIRDWREGMINARLKRTFSIAFIVTLIALLLHPEKPKIKAEFECPPTAPVFLNENTLNAERNS